MGVGNMKLREYQRDVLRASLRDYRAGIRRQLWVLPTGGGKTAIAAKIPELVKQQPGQQGVFIVNRDDLAWQAERTFKAANPTLRVEVEKANSFASVDADVIIASLQTIAKGDGVSPRFARFDPNR